MTTRPVPPAVECEHGFKVTPGTTFGARCHEADCLAGKASLALNIGIMPDQVRANEEYAAKKKLSNLEHDNAALKDYAMSLEKELGEYVHRFGRLNAEVETVGTAKLRNYMKTIIGKVDF